MFYPIIHTPLGGMVAKPKPTEDGEDIFEVMEAPTFDTEEQCQGFIDANLGYLKDLDGCWAVVINSDETSMEDFLDVAGYSEAQKRIILPKK